MFSRKFFVIMSVVFILSACGGKNQLKADYVDSDIKKALYGYDRKAANRALLNPKNKGASELGVIRWLYGIGGADGRGECSCK